MCSRRQQAMCPSLGETAEANSQQALEYIPFKQIPVASKCSFVVYQVRLSYHRILQAVTQQTAITRPVRSANVYTFNGHAPRYNTGCSQW